MFKKDPSRIAEALGHEVYHSKIDHGLARVSQFFIVFAETTIPSQPSECSLDHPAVRQYLETLHVVASPDNFQYPPAKLVNPINQHTRISAVSPDQLQTFELPLQLDQHPLGTVAVLHVGRVNDHRQDQSQRVYDNMALATLDLLAGIVTANPLFSVVLTL